MHVPTIRTERLDLVWMSPAFITASLEGRTADAEAELGAGAPDGWQADEGAFLRLRLTDLAEDASSAPWLIRAVVLRVSPPAMVGHVGFHGKPRDGVVEIGYTTFRPFRRRGYASEAASGLLAWAAEDPRVERFRASVGPWNRPSLSLVERLGFHHVGSRLDEVDGEELVFERPAGAGG